MRQSEGEKKTKKTTKNPKRKKTQITVRCRCDKSF